MKRKSILSGLMCALLMASMFACAPKVEAKSVSDKFSLSLTKSITDQLVESLQSLVINNCNKDVKVLFASDGENHTHQYIAQSALTILKNNKGTSVLNTGSNPDIIACHADWPDVLGNETDSGTFAGHFYNPDTGKNWMNQTSPTAKSRALSYFNQAVNWYNSGEIEEALICLGKGSHYVADLNEPHHASNLTAVNSNHSEFEKYVDTNRYSFAITGNTIAESEYITAKNSTLSTVLQNGAIYAKSLATEAQNKSTYSNAGKKCVQHAIINTVQYFYKFCIEVGIY